GEVGVGYVRVLPPDRMLVCVEFVRATAEDRQVDVGDELLVRRGGRSRVAGCEDERFDRRDEHVRQPGFPQGVGRDPRGLLLVIRAARVVVDVWVPKLRFQRLLCEATCTDRLTI